MTRGERLRRKHVARYGMKVGDVIRFPSCGDGCPSPKHRGIVTYIYKMAGQEVATVCLLCWPGKTTVVGLQFAVRKGETP